MAFAHTVRELSKSNKRKEPTDETREEKRRARLARCEVLKAWGSFLRVEFGALKAVVVVIVV